MNQKATVPLSDLEKDDRIDEIQKSFVPAVQAESGYQKLPKEQKRQIDTTLETIADMRFDSVDNFITVANSLLAPAAKELTPYLEIALNNARATLPDTPGVLVIYTGGTIGSAPRDETDPDSPQVVMPWVKLKAAAPRLSSLGYPIDAISFVEPLDSCNVGPTHWRTMTNIIKEHYADYADLGEYQREPVPASALLNNNSEESLAVNVTHYRDLFVSKILDSKIGTKQTLGFKLALQADESVNFTWQDAELNIYVQN